LVFRLNGAGKKVVIMASAKIARSRKPPHPKGLAESAVTVSVVMPTLNEAKNLPHVLPRMPDWVDEVLLVDGFSTDGTIEEARRLCPNIRVVMQEGQGKGAALRTGFAVAKGDIIVTVDADGSTDPAEMSAFVDALLAGADYAKGSRFAEGGGSADMPFHRIVGNTIHAVVARMLFGGSYTDVNYGYNAFWRHVILGLDLDCDGFEVEALMNVRALRAGLNVVEVPSFEYERLHGTGHLRSIPDGWRILRTILLERFRPNTVSVVPREKPVEMID